MNKEINGLKNYGLSVITTFYKKNLEMNAFAIN